jgi:predicted MPP superfamily phosphohydrolase
VNGLVAFLISWAYNLLLLAADVLALRFVWVRRPLDEHHRPRPAGLGTVLFAGSILAGIAWILPFALWLHLFRAIRLWSWAIFVHVPLLLLAAAWLFGRGRKASAAACVVLSVAIAGVGIDAFFLEPHDLEVTHTTVPTAKITKPVRIVVVADIQVDSVGDYERRALAAAMAEKPDLLIFAGDYVQEPYPEEHRRLIAAMREALLSAGIRAPLGVYAVQGNVDDEDWERMFDGTGAVTFPTTRTVTAGELSVTGLSKNDSFAASAGFEPGPGFQVVVGHAPNFARRSNGGDLLIAGHTHGGQVRLPIIGPLMTLSKVPRSWAAGMTGLGNGRVLYVSRGVGMERGAAPRLRFRCRPELAVIDVVPAPSGTLPG